MSFSFFKKKIGLTLGGGAAKGLAHIGVLKAFHKKKQEIHCISGVSVGALIASYFAFGKKFNELDELADILNAKSIVNFRPSKLGLINTDAIRDIIIKDLGDVLIEDARIPLAIGATDIETGECVIFHEGSLAKAVCASVAIPGIVEPVQYQNRFLVDGGISKNILVQVLEDMGAKKTIAVDLNGVTNYEKIENVMDVIGNAIDIAIDLNTKHELQKADAVISLDLSDYSRLDNSHKIDEVIEKGYQAALNIL